MPRHGLALSLYIVYIETVIYISACLKYCINVNLPSEGEGMAAPGCQRSGVGCVGVCVCAHVTLPLSSLLHPYSKKTPPKNPGEPGWVERGVGLGMAEEDPLCSLLPALTHTQRDAPRAPHPHVPVLFGGCSWFSRSLSHSSDPNRPRGSRMCWDCPWEHFVCS